LCVAIVIFSIVCNASHSWSKVYAAFNSSHNLSESLKLGFVWVWVYLFSYVAVFADYSKLTVFNIFGRDCKLAGIVISAAVAIVISALAGFFHKLFFLENVKLFVANSNSLMMLLGFVFFPLLQELLFRGCIYTVLETRVPIATIAIVSSYLWVLQLNVSSIIDFACYFVLGIVLSYVRFRFKNIWSCYVLHFFCILYTMIVQLANH
jgi:membrane protease YdiL (CAAX protease family)